MEIIFNGKAYKLQASITIQEFLDQVRLDCAQTRPRIVAANMSHERQMCTIE